MKSIKLKNIKRERRKKRNRAKIFGTAEKPRLSLFRSNKYTYVQFIDDVYGKTLASLSTRGLSNKKSGNKTKQAYALGELAAEQLLKQGVEKIVFNKGSYKYHGRVKAVAEGARAKGLKF
ncbi:MAG: 50S ribosomal protein L18 [Candidatus Harrisonbacteria bacterium RIFCSPLOWO2_02_FULL_41_11]|uniref:Large ribosomal subunit protein uL18 n=1 Tax=Candidatus Harrisonbacteria bacterium RIFCSPHIGHO2_02_FULL_42_16 TaxID=1798404 RepID=A0A1G1ZIQ0_9BACT|nr:MAG: 50S ribosomal protein L18 [Candidatus Harrisonbacteria bacterium RIFCSPHIGHO2_02_FULL_42_16]OGY67653.1 MAG: 50S ribosomal protein L18 [Candidatus Harrisonbacteria bacterium RIFCSPLOWO2_02_FULL_41_11]